jgi:hypothetical protein
MRRSKRHPIKKKDFPSIGISSKEEKDLRHALKESLKTPHKSLVPVEQDISSSKNVTALPCDAGPSVRSHHVSTFPSPFPTSSTSLCLTNDRKLTILPTTGPSPNTTTVQLTDTQLQRKETNRLKALELRQYKQQKGILSTEPIAATQIKSSITPPSCITNHGVSLVSDCQSSIPQNLIYHAKTSVTSTTQLEASHTPNGFKWGDYSEGFFTENIHKVYEEIVFWRKNLFQLPKGEIGKAFVIEMTRLFNSITPGNPLEPIAMKAIAVMPQLLLQRPHPRSKDKENRQHLIRRMEKWRLGDVLSLLSESRTLQSRLLQQKRHIDDKGHLIRGFTNLMLQGKINAALRLISDQSKGGILPLTADIQTLLQKKHPPAESSSPDALINGSCTPIDSIIFAGVDAHVIQQSALHTKGAAGPSGGDADFWRQMCLSFGEVSSSMCDAMALFARRLATQRINPIYLEAFLASRLIPLDKCPGVRPIGVGEIPRRIIGKAIVKHIKLDIQKATGPLQLCAGQEAGCEASIHAMTKLFAMDDSEAVLLVDADNAFNRLNRSTALWNLQYICPPIANFSANCYEMPSRLFIVGGAEISSCEGTTQGDPLSMPLYALAITPLIRRLQGEAKQIWYADDAQATGSLHDLRRWWDKLVSLGPKFGYFANPSKTILVVKPEKLSQANEIFAGTGISFAEGARDLGAAIGTTKFIEKYLAEKVSTWCKQMELLSTIAEASPHAAHAAYVHGLQHRWAFLQRSIPHTKNAFIPLETIIRQQFIPALLGGRLVSDIEREMISLPGKFGGLAIDNAMMMSDERYADSVSLTEPLIKLITEQEIHFSNSTGILHSTKRALKTKRDGSYKQIAKHIAECLPEDQRRAMLTAQEKGASYLVTTLPIKKYGFSLSKCEFRDQLLMRYRWPVPDLPSTCACGATFSVDHSQCCHLGGFINMRHDELRDMLAHELKEVLHDVQIEPQLQPLSGEILNPQSAISTSDARSDIRARGFWNREQNAYFDIRVFYPHARSYLSRNLDSLYTSFEREKKRHYNDRIINVEQASFTPLIFSSCGGVGKEASITLKKMATLLADKRKDKYSSTMCLLRCRIAFSLMRAASVCLRGSRIVRQRFDFSFPSSIVNNDSHIDTKMI